MLVRYLVTVGTLKISLLGGFQLDRDGILLDPIPLRAGRSLIGFLLVNRERTHTRNFLAGTFWPELPDSQARRRLSQALWQIRAHVDQGNDTKDRFLVTAQDRVHLNPHYPYWLDVEQFELELRRANSAALSDPSTEAESLEAAVSLYKGDLLEGFYDDWAVPDRERLRRAFLRAIGRLSDVMVSRGDYETAMIHALCLTQHDPFQEEAHQRVMRLAVLLGRHNDAIRQYKLCRSILTTEFRTEPSRVTRDLLRAALRDREEAPAGPAASPGVSPFDMQDTISFVGREQERSTLAQRLDAALANRGGLVLLEGEIGIGKTRLLREAAKDAAWRGMDVLWGKSVQSGGRPYAALADALNSGLTPLRAQQLKRQLEPAWLRELVHLAPLLRDSIEEGQEGRVLRPADEQLRMKESITFAFRALSDISPTMVVLDDMHWADADTVQALVHLSARAEDRRLLIAIAYRHTDAHDRSDVWAAFRAISQEPSCTRISLGPCSSAQTEELVRSCLGLPVVSAELARRVFRETGGIPLFVIEALRSEHTHGHLTAAAPESAEDDRTLDHPPLALELRGLIRNRLDGLTPEARAVADLLSVHDGEFLLAEVVAALDLEDTAALRGVDVLTRRGLVAGRSGHYRLVHELLRRVLYEDLTPSERLALHGRAGSVIEAHRPEEVEVLAYHFRVAHMPDRAAAYLEQAAVRAISVSAYATAVDYLAQAAQALAEAAAAPEQRFRVLSRYEEILDLLGCRAEQEEALTQMEQCAMGGSVIDVIRRRSWWLAHQDRLPEAEAEARRAVNLASAAGDRGRHVAALSTLGMIACFAGRATDGVQYLERAATLRGANLRQQADARNALGQNLLDLQRFDEAEPQLLAALALYGELQDSRGQAEVLGMLGTLRMERGESDLAESALQRALETSQAIRYRHGEAVYQMNLGILYALNHKPQSACRAFEQAARTYEHMGNGRGQALVLSNSAWLRHSVLGEDTGAETDAQHALRVYREMGDARGQAQCLGVLGSVSYRRGESTEAVALLQESLALAREADDSWIEAQVLAEWARCELEAGLADSGLVHADCALGLCLRLDMRDLAVSVNALRGRLLVELQRPEEAMAATTAALRGSRPGANPPYSVTFAHSLALAASHRQAEADRYLQIAHRQVLALLSDLPDGRRDTAVASVPAHRAVIDAWSARRPEQTQYSLARVGAPTGRPLAENERTAVSWTIHAPDDLAIRDDSCRRRQRLLRLIAEAEVQGGTPTIAELADALRTSVVTVRRDLAFLRQQGLAVRTRGTRGHHTRQR